MDYSENKPIWPGSSSFTTGDTPFGFFDNDTLFQQQADSFAKHAAQNVGYPIMDVELLDINFYNAFESAVIEYSNQVICKLLASWCGVYRVNDSPWHGQLWLVNIARRRDLLQFRAD